MQIPQLFVSYSASNYIFRAVRRVLGGRTVAFAFN